MANGSLHSVHYAKETTYGEAPTGIAYTGLPITGTTLGLAKDSLQSQTIRGDRQIADFRLGANNVSGDLNFELVYQPSLQLLEWALFSLPPTGTIARSVKGGVTETSFTVIRKFEELGVSDKPYTIYSGCIANSLTLNIAANSIVTATIGVIGQSSVLSTGIDDIYPRGATLSDPVDNSAMDSFTGAVRVNSVQSAVITEATITLTNNVAPRFILGKKDSIKPSIGRINATGSITAFFEDNQLVESFLNEANVSLEFDLLDPDGKAITIVIPKAVLTAGSPDVTSEGSVTLTIPFQAVLNSAAETNIIINSFEQPASANSDIPLAPLELVINTDVGQTGTLTLNKEALWTMDEVETTSKEFNFVGTGNDQHVLVWVESGSVPALTVSNARLVSANDLGANISKFLQAKGVAVSNTNLSALLGFRNLNSIDVNNTDIVGSITELQTLTGLTSLRVWNTDLAVTTAELSKFTGLTYLSIPGMSNLVGDVGSLSQLTKLTFLSLIGSANVSGDISAFSKLVGLTELHLNNSPVSGEISSLSSLTSLQVLLVGNTEITGDIAELNNFPLLRHLTATSSAMTGDLSSLTELSKLFTLSINGSAISGTMGLVLVSNAGLTTVNMSDTRIGVGSGVFIGALTDIKIFKFDNCPGFQSTAIDALLAKLENSAFSVTEVSGIGTTPIRTSNSDSDLASLQARGVTVTLN